MGMQGQVALFWGIVFQAKGKKLLRKDWPEYLRFAEGKQSQLTNDGS